MILDMSRNGRRILEIPVNVTYYDTRESRVIKGFLKYRFNALGFILLKLLYLGFLLRT